MKKNKQTNVFLYSYSLFTLMINPAAILHGSFIALITQQFELLINYIAFSTKIDFPRFCLNKICTQIRMWFIFSCLFEAKLRHVHFDIKIRHSLQYFCYLVFYSCGLFLNWVHSLPFWLFTAIFVEGLWKNKTKQKNRIWFSHQRNKEIQNINSAKFMYENKFSQHQIALNC